MTTEKNHELGNNPKKEWKKWYDSLTKKHGLAAIRFLELLKEVGFKTPMHVFTADRREILTILLQFLKEGKVEATEKSVLAAEVQHLRDNLEKAFVFVDANQGLKLRKLANPEEAQKKEEFRQKQEAESRKRYEELQGQEVPQIETSDYVKELQKVVDNFKFTNPFGSETVLSGSKSFYHLNEDLRPKYRPAAN